MAKFLRLMPDGEPGFLVHPQAKIARIGLAGGYKFKKLKGDLEGNVRAKPDKNLYSHIVEAGEYMMMGAGEGRSLIARTQNVKRETEAQADYAILG